MAILKHISSKYLTAHIFQLDNLYPKTISIFPYPLLFQDFLHIFKLTKSIQLSVNSGQEMVCPLQSVGGDSSHFLGGKIQQSLALLA